MNLIIIAAVVAVCGAAKLDRTYLPPASAKTAGGAPGSLQTPFSANSFNERASNFPKGSFTNDFQGVVVDAAAAGTRASGEGETGLGGPRISYGSTDSKVGEAAFRDAPNFNNRPFQSQGPNEQSQDGQTASSQVSAEDFNQNRFAPRVESKPERAQAAFDRVANTLRFENEVGPESYHFAYETDNGISAEENGVATNGVQAQGGFSYTGDDGQVYTVTYVADEGGYQPRGDHLPTPPPIPEEILKALERNAKDEAAGVVDDGSYDAQRYNAGGDYSESDSGNIEYSDRETTKFGKRPESVATPSGTFIDQNSQAFRPNSNALPGQEGSAEESQANGFGSSSSVENLGQASQPSRGSASNNFGARKEYLPPTNGFDQNGRPQRPFSTSNNNRFNGNSQTSAAFSASAPQSNTLNGNSQVSPAFGNAQSENYQGSQPSSNFARPSSNRLDVLAQSASKESSQESNRFVQPLNNFAQGGQESQNSGNRFGSRNEYLPPVNRIGQNGSLRPQRPTQSAEVASSSSFNAFSQNGAASQPNNGANEQFSSSSKFGSGSQSAGQFSNFRQQPQAFNNRFSQNQFQSKPNQGQSDASFGVNSQRPTSQPSIELTTPVESTEETQDISSGPSASLNVFNSQNNRPASQYANRPNGIATFSRPQNQPTVTKTQKPSFSQGQNQFNRPSLSSNQQSSEENLNENVRDVSDGQFAPSTVRPTLSQAQGADDSYYYRQPSRPFNTPSGSRFSSPSSSQFDRVSQPPQGSGQFSAESQDNSFAPQNNYNQGTIKYPVPPTLAPATPTVSFEQFQGSTTASQPQYTEASISPFQALNQDTTKYSRPTSIPTASTQYNEITQATASSFSSAPTISFGSRPTYQQPSQFNYQSQQQVSQFSQEASNQAASQEDSSSQVPTQQYSGEIYEYSKPAQGLPAQDQKESGSGGQNIPEPQPTPSQFDATQGSSNVQEYTQQPTGPTFGARPIGSQRPQFGQFSSQEPLQGSRPQFNAQASVESQEYQGKPAGAQSNRSKCCQSLDARLQPFRGVTQETGPTPTQSQFGSAFTAPSSQTVSQNTGFGEVFGGPRQPPSFNQETGYHY